MKHFINSMCLCIAISISASAQMAPDFTFTDTDGISHTLYEDYLDQGITVVIKIFFVACPPCNAIAPSVQQKYEDWGEGEFDVQFIEFSNKTWDNNSNVASFKAMHGITFPGAGNDGGGFDAQALFTSGDFGPFFGTPSFYVIGPDGNVTVAPNLFSVEEAIIATGATGDGGMNQPTTAFNLNIVNAATNQAQGNVTVKIGNAGNANAATPINLSSYENVEEILTAYPNLNSATLFFEKNSDPLDGVSTIDITLMVRHILGITLLDQDYKLIAADINEDDKISGIDVVALRKVILGIDGFSNGNIWKFDPPSIQLTTNPGNTINLNTTAIKIGNLH